MSMYRVDGLGFQSKSDLLQRQKTSTNKYISIYRKTRGHGVREESRIAGKL